MHNFPAQPSLQLVRRAFARSEFYHSIYDGLDLEDSASFEYASFRQLPYITPGQVQQASRQLVCGDLSDARRVFLSSSTTGAHKKLLLSREDVEEWTLNLSEGLALSRVDQSTYFIPILSYSHSGSAELLDAAERLGVITLPISVHEADSVVALLPSLDTCTLFGMPTTLLPLGRKYFESGLSNVKSLIVCGELITNGTRRLLSHLWRTNDISELYGSVETMMLGFGSPQCEGVHAVSRGTFIELINPVTEEPARDYELGEIIVTTFRDLMPLIRYKLGDLGVVLPDRCVCGRMAPRYRVLGRTDSVFIAGSAIVFPVDIQAICDDHFAITGERVCRLIIDITRSPDETDILNIHVATHLDRFDMRTFVDYFRSSLAVVNADFGLALKNGAVLVNPASLKLNVAESRKVSLMVNDVRQHALIRHIEEQQYSQRQMRWARSSVEKAR